MKMKAITVLQPWASLIAAGLKGIETRTHNRFACLKGHRIAIHAGLRFDLRAAETIYAETAISGIILPRRFLPERLRIRDYWPRGAILCTARVLDSRRLNWMDGAAALCPTEGLYGLVLHDIITEGFPVEATGKQGIWEWEQADENI